VFLFLYSSCSGKNIQQISALFKTAAADIF